MNPPSNAPRRRSARIGDAIVLVVAAAAVVNLLLVAARLDSVPLGFLTTASFGPNPLELSQWRPVDAVLSALPQRGNLVATLPGLAPADQPNHAFAAVFYPRAVYLLWPRRMFVAPSDIVIVRPADFAAAKYPDDPQWLVRHDVRAAAQFHLVNNRLSIEPVPLPLRP